MWEVEKLGSIYLGERHDLRLGLLTDGKTFKWPV